MQYVGALFLISIVVILWHIANKKTADWKRLTAVGVIGLFVGVALLLGDRITGVKVKGVGEISAVVAQATADAEKIANIRAELESQRDSLQMVVRDANNAQQKIEELSKLSDEAAEQLRTIEQIQSEASIVLKEIRNLSQFSHTLVLAENDNRGAFQELLKIANTSGPFREAALAAVEQIVIDVNPMYNVRVDPDVPWEVIGVSLEESSLLALKQAYSNLQSTYKPKFLSEFWKQERFPVGKRLEFLSDVIKNEGSLRALHRACILLNKEAHLNKNILGASMYLDWWQENRAKYLSN